ncbi:trans-aconitate methyltransferase 2 [Orobanche hederae]
MSAVVIVAIVAALGNLIQGWDSATMAGGIIHIKSEFKWENEPTMEGLTMAMSLFGATLVTLCSGGMSDWLGRRPMLIISSIFYFVSSILMMWSPNVYLLLFARLLDGFGIGLAVTVAPLYISEMSPPEIRGLLSTLPQFTYTGGMFLSYSLVFCMSLRESSSWRLMFGFLFAPSLIYFALTTFYLPESPRWLMSKGRVLEARRVLQRLRGREDVSGEMALLVEGLEISGETEIEEYIIAHANELPDEEKLTSEKEEIRFFSPEGLSSVVAVRVPGQSFASLLSRHESIDKPHIFSTDPIVTLFDSMHEKLPDTARSKGSIFFPHLGSMFSVSGSQTKNEEWDETVHARHDEDYASNGDVSEIDESLHSPLISRQTTSYGNTMSPHGFRGISSYNRVRQEIHLQSGHGEAGESTSIGSGWHLAWKWKEGEGSFKRIFLHEDGATGSWRDSLDGEFTKAAGLVSQPALCKKRLMDQHPVGPAMIHPSTTAAEKGPHWKDLFEPGVKHALLVGMGIQILQQLLGINAVLYYTPQILEQAGVQVLLSNMGISPKSSSLLISAVMTLLMLTCVVIAMRLMDVSGRRSLLLNTNPVLTASLTTLVIVRVVHMNSIVKATVSTASVIFYSCFFAMGFGPIPNILCAEIFPTRVRGVCIAICAFTSWICSIIVTYTLPVMLSSIGLAGVFSIYATASIISWAFVYFKVPETKGMPLEVIIDFFAVGAKHTTAADRANNYS